MFRSLFGSKSDKPGPPKNQIEVVCPACGAAQYEPRLVVSTFCKKCGVHLSINRKKVTASSVTRSGMGMPDPWADVPKNKPAPAAAAAQPEPAAPSEVPPPAPPPERRSNVSPPAVSQPTGLNLPVSDEEAAEGGFGVFLKQQSLHTPAQGEAIPSTISAAEEPAPAVPAGDAEDDADAVAATAQPEAADVDSDTDAEEDTEPLKAPASARPLPQSQTPDSADDGAEIEIPAVTPPAQRAPDPVLQQKREEELAGKKPQSNAPPPTPAPAPMSASTLQKMKAEGMYRNQYFKDAECFDCSHKFKVSRSTRSTGCPNCGSTICLEDVEINMPSMQAIRTRGDVLIRKRGQVTTDVIICKDLRCQGTLEANVQATGDAIFRAVGNMVGEIRCRRFIVEKGADLVFLNEVHAEEVEVYARVTATIFSTGSFVIGNGGSVNGDISARSVSIEPGGELNGGMSIIRGPAAPKPPQPSEEDV